MNDLQTAIRNAGANTHLKREVQEKLQAHRNRIAKARKAGEVIWIEAYDPKVGSVYYHHPDKQEVRWDRPSFYVMADEDDQMRSVICIQCMYRAKIARQRYLQDAKYAEIDPATRALRRKAREALNAKMEEINRQILARHESYLAQVAITMFTLSMCVI